MFQKSIKCNPAKEIYGLKRYRERWRIYKQIFQRENVTDGIYTTMQLFNIKYEVLVEEEFRTKDKMNMCINFLMF